MKKNKARDRLKANPKLVDFVKLALGTNYIKRGDLYELMVGQFGEQYSDSEMRKAKQSVEYDKAIIADFGGAGYRYGKFDKAMSDAELMAELEALCLMQAVANNKVEAEKMKMRPRIALIKVIEKELKERERDRGYRERIEREGTGQALRFFEDYHCEG